MGPGPRTSGTQMGPWIRDLYGSRTQVDLAVELIKEQKLIEMTFCGLEFKKNDRMGPLGPGPTQMGSGVLWVLGS
jgi:hypothetical protein